MNLKERIEASPVVFVFGAIFAGFLAGIGAYKSILEIAQLEVVPKQELVDLRSKANSKSNAETPDYRVGVTQFPEVQDFVGLLRQNGYHVDLAPGAGRKEDFSVITVGFEVPPTVAAKIIRLAHNRMPWVRYICLLNSPDEKVLFLNASNQWAEVRNLKPLSEEDFELLGDKDQSIEEFHRLIATFGL